MCHDCNEPQPCHDCPPITGECLDCIDHSAVVVEVAPRPNYCAEIVTILSELELNSTACNLYIQEIVVQGQEVFVNAQGGSGVVEYSDNGVLFQLNPVFVKPTIDTFVTYYAREKARVSCVATKTYDFDIEDVCVPSWRDADPIFTICIDQVRHKKQIDGCGGERFIELLNDWQPTGRTRCSEVCSPAPSVPTIQANDIQVCQNDTVNLTAVGGVGTIRWYNKQNLTASIGEGTTIDVGAGTYVARAESLCGTSVFSNEIAIALTETFPPTISAGTQQLCGPQTTTLTATGGSTGTKWWYRNGVNTGVTGDTYPSATGGSYYVIIEGLCSTSPPSNTIGINYVGSCGCTPVPTTPQISVDKPVLCGSQQATIMSTGHNGTLTWYRNGAATGQTGSPLVTSVAGTYSAMSITTCGQSIVSNFVVVTNAGPCNCSPQPTPPTIATNDLQICANQSTVLSAAGGTGATIKWYKNGEDTTSTGINYTAIAGGVYTARYVNNCGESGDSNALTISYSSICQEDVQPSGEVGTIIAPQCVNGELGLAAINLVNLQNVHHYRYCVGPNFTCPTNCESPDGIVAPGETTTSVLVPAPSGGTSTVVTIRLYRDSDCISYRDIYATVTSPVCGSPDGTVAVISQPQCNNGALTQASVRLIGLQNVSRVRYCYNSIFVCDNTCQAPDYVIPEGVSTFDIQFNAPAQGTSQAITIRLYRDGNCTVYKDVTVTIVSPLCQCQPQPVIPNIARVFLNSSTTTEISSICGSETATLQASGGNGLIKWYNASNPTIAINTGDNIQVGAGSYQARSVTSCGESGLSNIIIVTNSGPCVSGCNAIAPQIFGGGSFCAGENITLQAVGSCTGGVVRWKKDNTTLIATGQTLTLNAITTNNAGTYTAVCDLGNGCVSANSNGIVITVSSAVPPAPTIGANTANICGTAISTLSASNTSGTVTWFRNGVATGQTGTQIETQIAGVYTAKNSNNCGVSADSNAVTITYQAQCGCTPAPIAPTVAPSTASICGSQTVALTASGGNGTTYSWYRNGIFTGITGATFVASQGGNYTATTTNGCGESALSAVSVVTYEPSCGGGSTQPSAIVGTIIPPVCTGTQLLGNFSVYLNNVTNADRYEYCYGNFGVGGCTPCTGQDGFLVNGTNIISLPAPAQGVSQNVVVRIYNGTNCDSYFDVPLTLISPNCQTLCAINLNNSGGVGVFDNTYVATQTGTFYWKFDDFSIVDNLKIYRNGTLVVDTGYASGTKVGSIATTIGDSIRILINATVATVNGSSVNNSTNWEFWGNCSAAYTAPNCATASTGSNNTLGCHIQLVETAITCVGNVASLRVRARINSTAGSTVGNYRHDTLQFSIYEANVNEHSPTTVSGTGVNDYAEYTFTGLASGLYTVYVGTSISITAQRSFAQINVGPCS